MKKLFLSATLMWSVVMFAAELPLGLKTTKLIDLSWANPTTEYLQKNLERMEKESPVDGISIRVWGASRPVPVRAR